MATESVATAQISIDAREFLDRYKALQEVTDRLIGAEGVLAMLDEAFPEDTPANRALSGAWRLLHDCQKAAMEADWPIGYASRCEKALGIAEDAA